MPDAQDRVLAELAVEAGFLSSEEAGRYWQRLQVPGAPRLVPLLLQEGKLSQTQLEELKARFYAIQSGMTASSTLHDADAQPLPPSAPASTPGTFRRAGSSSSSTDIQVASETFMEAADPYDQPTVRGAPPSPADSWDDALRKDMHLARVLLERGATTQDRLRECRELQLQHRMRLGVVLAKKGYVDRHVLEQAVEQVRRTLEGSGEGSGLGSAPSASPPRAFPAPSGFGPPRDAPDDQPTVLDKRTEQDAASTVLNTPQGGLPAQPPARAPAPPGPDRFFSGPPTGLSVEELNPFAGMSNAQIDALNQSGRQNRAEMMKGVEPPLPALPSEDELDAFTDVPLPPPPGKGPVDLPPAGFGENRTSGFTPTGVPIGGEADSGSTKMKARDRAELKRVKGKHTVRKQKGKFPLVLLLVGVVGVALAVGLFFLVTYLDF
jgi:hypothetical protein